MYNSKFKSKYKRRSYRSGLEVGVKDQLIKENIKVNYETVKIEWQDLAYRTYTPDFVLPNGIIIETKGLFTASDRRKHIFVQKQHPELDIRFIFTNCNSKLNKKSHTTYGKWCEKNNFLYANKQIPNDWLLEVKEVLDLPSLIKYKGIKHEVI